MSFFCKTRFHKTALCFCGSAVSNWRSSSKQRTLYICCCRCCRCCDANIILANTIDPHTTTCQSVVIVGLMNPCQHPVCYYHESRNELGLHQSIVERFADCVRSSKVIFSASALQLAAADSGCICVWGEQAWPLEFRLSFRICENHENWFSYYMQQLFDLICTVCSIMN